MSSSGISDIIGADISATVSQRIAGQMMGMRCSATTTSNKTRTPPI